MYKGTKITSRENLYKAKQKAGQKAVNSRCRGAVLQNFVTCENSQVAKFLNLQNLQVGNFRNPAKFPVPSFSFAIFAPNLLRFDHASSNSARFIVFESD